jgi:hypothetical protein
MYAPLNLPEPGLTNGPAQADRDGYGVRLQTDAQARRGLQPG